MHITAPFPFPLPFEPIQERRPIVKRKGTFSATGESGRTASWLFAGSLASRSPRPPDPIQSTCPEIALSTDSLLNVIDFPAHSPACPTDAKLETQRSLRIHPHTFCLGASRFRPPRVL
jgi:hypothetical protein